jgi:hypothetical protein
MIKLRDIVPDKKSPSYVPYFCPVKWTVCVLFNEARFARHSVTNTVVALDVRNHPWSAAGTGRACETICLVFQQEIGQMVEVACKIF